jgi:hypothetical protein
MLHLEAPFNFTTIGWGIQVHEKNESESSDKEQVKNQEVHIIETSKIERCPKDVKAYSDMVNADTSKQVSPTNPHVSEVTPQVLRIANHILKVQSLEVQASKVQVSEVQDSEPQVSDIETLEV